MLLVLCGSFAEYRSSVSLLKDIVDKPLLPSPCFRAIHTQFQHRSQCGWPSCWGSPWCGHWSSCQSARWRGWTCPPQHHPWSECGDKDTWWHYQLEVAKSLVVWVKWKRKHLETGNYNHRSPLVTSSPQPPSPAEAATRSTRMAAIATLAPWQHCTRMVATFLTTSIELDCACVTTSTHTRLHVLLCCWLLAWTCMWLCTENKFFTLSPHNTRYISSHDSYLSEILAPIGAPENDHNSCECLQRWILDFCLYFTKIRLLHFWQGLTHQIIKRHFTKNGTF